MLRNISFSSLKYVGFKYVGFLTYSIRYVGKELHGLETSRPKQFPAGRSVRLSRIFSLFLGRHSVDIGGGGGAAGNRHSFSAPI